MESKYSIKKSISNAKIDANAWKRLDEAKKKRNWKIFLYDEKKLSKWKNII